MDPAEFRRLGHELVDWVADYREHIAELPVMSRVAPGEIQSLLPGEPPREALGLDGIIADLDRIVLPGITHWNHPGWFAYFPSNTDLSSVLADLVAAGLGAAVHELADEPGRPPRSRTSSWSGCARCSACPTTFSGRHPRQRQHGHALRAALRPRADERLLAEPRRPAGGGGAARRLRLRPGVTAPSPRPRCWPASAPTTCA